ncbi:MAG: dethiobiotin synthase [Cyanobacteria bacterium P01_F01_bin.42]
MTRSLLIAGTDTGVGKTALTAALVAYWQTYRPQESVAVFKPIQSGAGDREFYQSNFELSQTGAEITPLQFEQPLAPPIAADLEERPIDLARVQSTLQELQKRYGQVLIEGIGGLGSPITHELVLADLARDWRLPTVLVVPVRLGSIGQAVANVALARQSNVDLRGIILSDATSTANVQELTPVHMIQKLTNTPVLGKLETIKAWSDRAAMAAAASSLTLAPLMH